MWSFVTDQIYNMPRKLPNLCLSKENGRLLGSLTYWANKIPSREEFVKKLRKKNLSENEWVSVEKQKCHDRIQWRRPLGIVQYHGTYHDRLQKELLDADSFEMVTNSFPVMYCPFQVSFRKRSISIYLIKEVGFEKSFSE